MKMEIGPKYALILAAAMTFMIGSSCARTDSPSPDQPPKGRFVTRQELGDKWPFTVDSGYVDCPDGISAIFRTGNTEYGLNGMATSRGFAEPDAIRKSDPSIPGAMISIGPMIDLARQQCK
jgi:hypothetical protein